MSDIGTRLSKGLVAFLVTRLEDEARTRFKDLASLLDALDDDVPTDLEQAWTDLKDAVADEEARVADLTAKVQKLRKLVVKLAADARTDLDDEVEGFTLATAMRLTTRVVQALLAADQTIELIASEVVATLPDARRPAARTALRRAWDPIGRSLRSLATGTSATLDAVGDRLLGLDDLTDRLRQQVAEKDIEFEADRFDLSVEVVGIDRNHPPLRLSGTRIAVFLSFRRVQVAAPTDAEKDDLVERDGTWWRADEATVGIRFAAKLQPGLSANPLMKQLTTTRDRDPEPTRATPVTLDVRQGLHLGDGSARARDEVVLPFAMGSSLLEVRDLTLALRRRDGQVQGFDLHALVAAQVGGAIGATLRGIGVSVDLPDPRPGDDFPFEVGPRWPDRVGLAVRAGAVKGGGHLEQRTRTYDGEEITEYGGVVQLEVLKAGVTAVGILSTHPFSFVLVMGVRFPTAIELSFGFTLNGVGGLLAVNRRLDTTALLDAMKDHVLDKVLFPSDPMAEAPTLLDKVAAVFPVRDGGFVVGPVVELGWGSQARIVEAKLGVVLALPDPKVVILGAVRVRAPSKVTPLTDFRGEVYVEVSAERAVCVVRLHDSKIAGYTVSGDLGLLLQWGGGGDFALSVGGFNPRYAAVPADFRGLERVTIDLSPPAVVKIVVRAYVAVTAGAVMAGVRGDLSADLGFASGKAWLQLDAVFRWAPSFGFAVDLDVGIDIEVFGESFANVTFRGALEGTTPWSVRGKAVIDVWWLPTVRFNVGPVTWGEKAPALATTQSPLALAKDGLDDAEAWKALLPADADQLVHLEAAEGAAGLLAHPLACLEVTQSRVPLETHLDRIGSAPVSAHRVAVGLPRTTTGPVAAVSTVTAPFAPGQFLALEGEALLARGGFEDLPSGCRLAAATTPAHGPAVAASVTWDTWVRQEDVAPRVDDTLDITALASVVLAHGLPHRHLEQRDNPYLPRPDLVSGRGADAVTVLAPGAAVVVRADDGAAVPSSHGVLTAHEAARAADVLTAAAGADADRLVAVAVGGARA